MENLGKAIYEHYTKYLGDPIGADSYPEYDIQLMGFQDAVQGCLTFGTMGLTLHAKALGETCEAVLTAEEDLDACADIFTKVLFYILGSGLPMDRGMAIGGIDSLNPEFYQAHHKSALYFTEPTMFPKAFREFGGKGRIYMAFFISPEEEAYLRKNGTENFEKQLEAAQADIIDLDRGSVVPGREPTLLS